ncbi:MAG: hypothetical protein H6819_09090 [Phycisphaerales bacterium]|nr:hypothetical protein [Phycisphaerales bacterium]MCB9856017.1 hypothetical protein [Phycisphaerales bacterium]
MANQERVLVVSRSALESAGIFNGLTFDVKRYCDVFFAPETPRFMPREDAEHDPSFKQLIPYVIIAHRGRILSYVRGSRAGEKRLVGQRSIGIGGHINPVDDELPLLRSSFRETYAAAVRREVAEEIIVDGEPEDRIVALINDDSTEVGKVHLGIVHYWELDTPNVQKREQMITKLSFMSPAELEEVRESLETWSSLCLDNMERFAGVAC